MKEHQRIYCAQAQHSEPQMTTHTTQTTKSKPLSRAKYGQGFDLALRYRNSLNSLCVPYTKNISMCKVVNVAGSK